MNLKLEMFDLETNERLAHRYCQYELNFDNKDDRGFQTLVSWCRSCVRGIRIKHMAAIELRIQFLDDVTQEDLFGGISREEFNKKAGAFLV